MADAGRVIEKLKAQIAALTGENAILATELEEVREQLEVAHFAGGAPEEAQPKLARDKNE